MTAGSSRSAPNPSAADADDLSEAAWHVRDSSATNALDLSARLEALAAAVATPGTMRASCHLDVLDHFCRTDPDLVRARLAEFPDAVTPPALAALPLPPPPGALAALRSGAPPLRTRNARHDRTERAEHMNRPPLKELRDKARDKYPHLHELGLREQELQRLMALYDYPEST